MDMENNTVQWVMEDIGPKLLIPGKSGESSKRFQSALIVNILCFVYF